MKVVPLSELNETAFSVGQIASIYQTPVYRALNNHGRICNGFLLIEKGRCLYQWDGGEVSLDPGALIYLPCGSQHKMTVLTDDIAFTRVDFTLTDPSGEAIVFSTGPLPVLARAAPHLTESIHQLTALFFKPGEALARTILLCTILQDIALKFEKKPISRLAPVTDYIAEHYREDIDCARLGELCYLSKAQMYRLFREEMGCSPIKYRNRLRIEHACRLLAARECSVSEIASMVGFESVYYFSREFKKITGVPPSEF